MVDNDIYRPGLGRNAGLVQQLKEFQQNPRSLVFVPLAESYRQEGLFKQALEILEEGLAFHPALSSALIAKARCLFELRRYAEALAEVQGVIQSNPENIRAHKLQAEISLRLGQRKAAIRALTTVVSLFPQDVEAVKALEELENLESKTAVPLEKLSRASVDFPPSQGRIEEFQVGSFSDSLRSIGVNEAEEPQEGKIPEPVLVEELEEDDTEPTFATRTIAELYLRQGLKAKAKRVLRKLIREDAANEWATETLQDLESDGILLPAQPPKPRKDTLAKKAKALEKILARVRMLRHLGA